MVLIKINLLRFFVCSYLECSFCLHEWHHSISFCDYMGSDAKMPVMPANTPIIEVEFGLIIKYRSKTPKNSLLIKAVTHLYWGETSSGGKRKESQSRSGLPKKYFQNRSFWDETSQSHLEGTNFEDISRVQKATVEAFIGPSLESFVEFFSAWD